MKLPIAFALFLVWQTTVVHAFQPTIQSNKSLQELKSSGWSRSRFQQHANEAATAIKTTVEKPQPRLAEYQEEIQPLLKRTCLECHGPDEQEGNFRLDTLDPNLHSGKDTSRWTEVFAVVSKGEMPPPDSAELPDEDRKRIVDWLAAELQTASIVRRQSTAQTAFRRMTRYEYNYALQDMLGLPWDFAKDLPPEAHAEDGFQNSSALLHMSVSQFETYHRLARQALSRAVVQGEKPKSLHWGVTMKDVSRLSWAKQDEQLAKTKEKHKDDPEQLAKELKRLEASFEKQHARTYFRELTSGKTALATWEYAEAKHAISPTDQHVNQPTSIDYVAILPAEQWLNIELGNLLPDEGTLRVRVRASRTNAVAERTPSLQLHFGWQASNEGRALLQVSSNDTPVTALPGAPEFYQWDVPLGEIYPRNSVRTTSAMGELPSPSEYIRLVNSSASPDDILVDYVEVQAPVFDQWPPPSHQRLFPASDNAKDEKVYAREIVSRFMTKAWRRQSHQRNAIRN